MRSWIMSLFFCCLCSIAIAQGADGSLTMTATVDRTVLLARLPANVAPETAMLQEIAPVKLTITLRNSGTKPLVLNSYDFVFSHLRLEVSGPQSNSVSRMALMIMRDMREPRAEDFITLQPGEAWTLAQPLRFPDAIGMTRYALRHFGEYRMRLHYLNLPYYRREVSPAWFGVASSEVISLTVLEASEPVNGVQMALQTQMLPNIGQNKYSFTAHVRNTGTEALIVPTWNFLSEPLQLFVNNKQLPATQAPNDATRLILPEDLYTTLEAASQQTFRLSGHFEFTDFDEPPVGDLFVTNPAGFVKRWQIRGLFAQARGVLLQGAAIVQAEALLPSWQGCLETPRMQLQWDATTYHQRRLRGKPEAFAMHINYNGPQDEPFPAFHLYTRKLDAPAEPGVITAVISDDEVLAFIDALAAAGLLSYPLPLETTGLAPALNGYTLTIIGGDHLRIPLGWNLAMCRQIEKMQAALPAATQLALAPLLARMSGEKAAWEVAEALQQPISLELPAGTAQSMADAIAVAVGHPQFKVNISNDLKDIKLEGMHFCRVPAADALRHLAAIFNGQSRLEGTNMSIGAVKGAK